MDLRNYPLQHLPIVAAPLIVYLYGLVHSLFLIRSLGKPAVFAATGCILLLLNTFFEPLLYQSIVNRGNTSYWPSEQIMDVVNTAQQVVSLIHSLGFSLVLTGIFVGRKTRSESTVSERNAD